ncbi:hypothetical protein BaRGS_00021187, partial [Batillaria attramentaria]
IAGEEAEPALHTAGENVYLSWKFPVTDAIVITVAKDRYTQALFYGSTQVDRTFTYFQYKDRVQVLPLYTGSVSFTMKNVTSSDAGRYKCFEGPGLGDLQIPDCGQMLVIVDRPEEVTVVSAEPAVVGQDLQLECVAKSTSVPADHGLPLLVQWYDSSGLEVSGHQYKVQVDGPRLLVRLVQRHDEGLHFSCRAADGLDMWSANSELYTLQPEYAPSVLSALVNGMEQTKARFTEGVRVNLTCLVDSNPAPQVTWYSMKDRNKPLVQQDLTSQTPVISYRGQVPRNTYISDFIIPSTECTHTNTYTCTAKNRLGAGIDGSIELIVVCMPRNTGGDLRLKSLYMSPMVAYPEPKIDRIISEDASGRRRLEETDRWTQSSSKSPADPYLTTLTLRFPNTTLEFFDKTYYLDISNNEGSRLFAFLLRAKGPPLPPNVIVASISDSEIVVHVTPGFHGGVPQTFIVKYQLQGTEDWVEASSNFQDTQDSQPVEMRVTDLEPSSDYNIQVLAVNKFGSSPSTTMLVVRTSGRKRYERPLPRRQMDITVYQGLIPEALRQPEALALRVTAGASERPGMSQPDRCSQNSSDPSNPTPEFEECDAEGYLKPLPRLLPVPAQDNRKASRDAGDLYLHPVPETAA